MYSIYFKQIFAMQSFDFLMATMKNSSLFVLFFAVFISLLASFAEANEERKVHVVYLGAKETAVYPSGSHHLTLLDQILENITPRESLVYSYSRSFAGFAAKLTPQETEKLAGLDGVVSVFPSRILKLHTTRSWDFLGFPENVNRNLPLESDAIVGMLDTGIWPESKSFSDRGLGPPPNKWKGTCVKLECNNKIIGARFYNFYNGTTEEQSPRDFEGHGTHTASTAAGRRVKASLYGLAKGTARGGLPSARLAVYKVCWPGCADVDVLAAFDDAIADGVDVISISIGHGVVLDYFEDSIAIGSFHAMSKGILVSASGGNSGPYRGSVVNVVPWMLVAAASSIDRNIVGKLEIGGNKTIWGASINTFPTQDKFYPFTYVDEFLDCGMNASFAKDKIVLCGYFDGGYGAFYADAKGTVQADTFYLDAEFTFALPGLAVSSIKAEKLMHYINSTKNPVAKIYKSEAFVDPDAPVVAGFSSRGPNIITANILKPDLSAPGIHILAAWSPNMSISGVPKDTRIVKYNILSGTSMACPHVSGTAAYVKSFHQDWSPAAIMSALITTATPMDPSLSLGAEFAYGAGQINPARAANPGLVYDANVTDYVQLLCDEGYTASTISFIAGVKTSCSKSATGSSTDLNYPSMALYVNLYEPFVGTFPRTVTNVGAAKSTYTLTVDSGSKLTVKVEPEVLSFEKLNEKQKFVVKVSGGPFSLNAFASASITWTSGNYSVRSVIVVYTDYTM